MTRNRVRVPAESTSCPGRPGPVSQVPGLDQMARATLAWVPVLGVSTSCTGGLGPWSEVPRCRTILPGDSCWGLRARGVDQLSRGLLPGSKCLGGRPALLCYLGPCPRSCLVDYLSRRLGPVSQVPGLDQISLVTWARLPVPALSTRVSWRLGPCSDGTWGRPAVPGDSGSGPRYCDVHQFSQATRARV